MLTQNAELIFKTGMDHFQIFYTGGGQCNSIMFLAYTEEQDMGNHNWVYFQSFAAYTF